MKKIHFHIGFEKTGSKSIQNFCARNSKALQERGIYYLDDVYNGLVFASTHWPIAAAYADVPSLVPPSKKLDAQEATNLIVEVANNTSCDTLLFSAEPFSSVLTSAKKIVAMKKALSDFDVKIIAYVRRQDNFFASHISSFVKGGHSFLYSDHITMAETIVSYENQDRYDYKLILSRWADAFGVENMTIRPFERDSLLQGDVVADFLGVLDVNIEDFPDTDVRDNESLSIEALLFLNLINRTATPEFTAVYIRQVLPALQKYQTKRISIQQLLSNVHRLEIIDLYAKRNAYVAKHYMDQRSQLFVQELPDADEPWSPVSPLSYQEVYDILGYLEKAAPGVSTKIISALCQVSKDTLENCKKAQSELFPAYGNNPD
jgi:hypothetical protein